MAPASSHPLRRSILWAGSFALWLTGIAPATSAELLPPPADKGCEVKVLNLAECIGIGMERSPALAAQWATLRATEAGKNGGDALKIPKCMAPDIDIRRQQSAIGLEGAMASVEFVEHYTVNAISRMYFGVVYAREQRNVAEEAVKDRAKNLQMAQEFLDAQVRQVTQEDVQKFRAALQQAQIRVLEAKRGEEILAGALKEAMGVGPYFCLDVADKTLPHPQLELCKEQVIELALSRRPEMRVQDAASAISCLEIEAQAAMRRNGRTFAMFSDIHVAAAPPLGGGPTYTPGPIGWEMPVKLVGPKPYRVERAKELHNRINAVREKTRQLIALEAQDAYTRYVEARDSIPLAKQAEDSAREVLGEATRKYLRQVRLDPDKLIDATAKLDDSRVKHLEARHKYVVALIYLENVTAGAIRPFGCHDIALSEKMGKIESIAK